MTDTSNMLLVDSYKHKRTWRVFIYTDGKKFIAQSGEHEREGDDLTKVKKNLHALLTDTDRVGKNAFPYKAVLSTVNQFVLQLATYDVETNLSIGATTFYGHERYFSGWKVPELVRLARSVPYRKRYRTKLTNSSYRFIANSEDEANLVSDIQEILEKMKAAGKQIDSYSQVVRENLTNELIKKGLLWKE